MKFLKAAYRGYLWPIATFVFGDLTGQSWYWHGWQWLHIPLLIAAMTCMGVAAVRIRRAK